MIDRTARDKYAQLLRHFAAGRITNFEYEDRGDELAESRDLSLREIHHAMWFSYDDFRKHKLTGKWKLCRQDRHVVARWIVFLYSSCDYEWYVPGLGGCLLNGITVGFYCRLRRKYLSGDMGVWPFACRSDLEQEAKQPRLLSGVA